MGRLSVLCLFVVGMASPVLADVISFKSGDRLTGKLVKIEDGKVVFEANEVGSVTIDLTRIESFSTDEPVELHLVDKTVIEARILAAEEDRFRTDKTDLLAAQTFDIANLYAINPAPKAEPKWSGSVSAGLTSTHGNTFTEAGSVAVDAQRRTEKDRINIDGLYLIQRAEEEDSVTGEKNKVTTQESVTFGGKYDHFLTEKVYAFVNGSFKKDHIADLDRRLVGGLGLGYQWVDEQSMHFNTDLGFAEVCEQYTTHGEVTKTDEVSLQMGYHFDWQATQRFAFMHNLMYFPSLGDPADYFLTIDAEVRASLTESMFANFKTIVDYDSTPGKRVGTTDVQYIMGVGWTF